MVPENLRFGGGVSHTVLHPAVAVIMILTGLLILLLPRRYAIVPFLISGILIPQDQVLVIGGLHFAILRVRLPAPAISTPIHYPLHRHRPRRFAPNQ